MAILSEDAFTNHWEETVAARSQSIIYTAQDPHVSLLVSTEGDFLALSRLQSLWREWPQDSGDP